YVRGVVDRRPRAPHVAQRGEGDRQDGQANGETIPPVTTVPPRLHARWDNTQDSSTSTETVPYLRRPIRACCAATSLCRNRVGRSAMWCGSSTFWLSHSTRAG